MVASLQLVTRFMLMPSTVQTAKFVQNGELFARMKLNAEISEDTAEGRLILQNVRCLHLAPHDAKKPANHEPDKVRRGHVVFTPGTRGYSCG